MSSDRSRLATGAFALLVGLLAATAALALSTRGTNGAIAAPSGASVAEASFGVLRMEAQEARPFADASRLAPGIESASVHSVWIGLDRYSAASTADTVCLDALRAGDRGVSTGGCAPISTAVASGLFTGSRAAPNDPDPDEVSIAALLPDEVKSVDITLASGEKRTVDVRWNIVAATFSEQPVSGRFVKADGADVVVNLKPEGR